MNLRLFFTTLSSIHLNMLHHNQIMNKYYYELRMTYDNVPSHKKIDAPPIIIRINQPMEKLYIKKKKDEWLDNDRYIMTFEFAFEIKDDIQYIQCRSNHKTKSILLC